VSTFVDQTKSRFRFACRQYYYDSECTYNHPRSSYNYDDLSTSSPAQTPNHPIAENPNKSPYPTVHLEDTSHTITVLVHMNGRIYDPLLSRFLSADLIVDGPETVQGFNRFSYVHNNPLTNVDPSGYWNVGVFFDGAHEDIAKAAWKEVFRNDISYSWSFEMGSSRKADLTFEHLFFGAESSFKHSTAPPGWSADKVKAAMMSQAEEWYTQARDLIKYESSLDPNSENTDRAYQTLGKLGHMLADSYCPAHVERLDSTGAIKTFLVFYGDNGQKSIAGGGVPLFGSEGLHKQLDNIYDKNGNLTPEAKAAIAANVKLLQLFKSGASWNEVKAFLDKEWETTENVGVGVGEKWEDLNGKNQEEEKQKEEERKNREIIGHGHGRKKLS